MTEFLPAQTLLDLTVSKAILICHSALARLNRALSKCPAEGSKPGDGFASKVGEADE
jgi:hypothetical protein